MVYTPKELITIMRQAKRLGVSEFQLGELKLKFGFSEPFPPRNPPNPKAEQEAWEENERELDGEEVEILKLSDPYAYEQHMIKSLDEDTPLGTQ